MFGGAGEGGGVEVEGDYLGGGEAGGVEGGEERVLKDGGGYVGEVGTRFCEEGMAEGGGGG